MRITFKALDFEGKPAALTGTTMLRVVAEISIQVDGRGWYSQQLFPVVEFAVQVYSWLQHPSDDRPDLIYTSMESETEGLIRFRRSGESWSLSAPGEEFKVDRPINLEEIDRACRDYLDALAQCLSEQYRLDLQAFIKQEVKRQAGDYGLQ